MADSAKDSKVEDVLSSVRRLVSEEVPRTSRTPVPQGPGALVLTDADRVQKDTTSKVNARSLEQRIAELEAAVDRGGQEFEPDGSEDQAMNVPDRIVYTRPPTSEEEANMRGTLRLSEIALIQPAPTEPTEPPELDAAAVASVPFRSLSRERDKTSVPKPPVAEAPVVEAPMAEDVPTQPAKKGNVTAFTSPDDVVERIDARAKQASVPSPQESAAPVSRPAPVEDAADKPVDDFDMALMAAVKASVAEVVQSELASAASEPTPASQSAPAPASEAKPHAEPVADDTMPLPEPFPEAPLPVSEENAALRRLVADLIREELQGELGERITRNVRKLVRREIKRALASENLL